MLYIWARLKAQIGEQPEDSSDFLLGQAKFGYDYEELADNRAVVRMKSGHYHLTDSQLVAKMRTLDLSNWADEVEMEELNEELMRRGYEPESLRAGFSGEDQRPAVKEARQPAVSPSRQASSSIPSSAPQQLTKREALMRKLQQSSDEQLRGLVLRKKSSGSKRASNTAQPTPQPRQSGSHSASKLSQQN